MTTRQRIEKMLCDRGLFESQAKSIMDFAIPKITEIYDNITWNRPASEYPDNIFYLLFEALRPYVVEWAEKNIPQAWWIPVFKR